ncbi:serine/threonine/tyrosine-interacting-like protein 2 [Lampris incognitus]|uniref:serine/threonine/tyrosine-interacting-like protein 2 n=1 Tax=Lampris incognitus TaxID=2546036 RepID=UPI0024B516A4|nr:serine/threonine/tyrosine-interacting-like protein 2 [Lampris incognitus]
MMEEGGIPVAMASESENTERGDQTVPDGDEGGSNVKVIQSHYLRCPSPSNFSTSSESRFSMISGSDAESIFMEPIHLSSAIAAKQIINEELPPRSVRVESIPESMLETAEQLMVEDLYNRVKDMIDDRSPYNTPCVLDIQRALVQDRVEAPINAVDEVWPNIFIAEKSVAVNKARLKRMGITHVLNTAHGTGVYTGEAFYTGMNIQYMGIEVDDFTDVDISPHFRTTAEFLDEALLTHKGKVLVDSMMGMSRSAVLVASYLMIFQHMTIMEALTTLRKKRAISPNEGFLKQLREFNETLMEERDDDDDTLSQCSVIDARARARIFGEGAVNDDDDEDTEEEGEERSMMGVKAHSIMMEEEEDGASVMSSVASSAAATALKSGWTGVTNRPGDSGMTEPQGELVLPGTEGAEHREEEDDGVGSMIREWQRRNEKYQNEEWWEAQLNSDTEDEMSLMGEQLGRRTREGADADLESITSEDVRAVKERVTRRTRRPPSDTMSTSSCTSYSDLWKQRLREIEEQAAARYRVKDEDGDGESTATEEGAKKIDEDLESILSDTSSMYNFCQKNKEKLTPLERWRIKRIQFGWNKKDGEDGEKSSIGGGEDDGEGEARTPALEDVNLTAYQTWKLKQQKRYGEENKDEILEMSRGEDSATAKRRQRREELLERSRKTLEESQSMCGWEAESCVSGGTIPLSAFWAGAGVAGPPSVANDDNMSMLSGRSSVISSVSQARSNRSTHPMGPPHPITPVPPIVPVPTVQGPGGEPMVNLASIQNWIANVVSETLAQKQSEMSLPPPSRAGSVLSCGGASSVVSRRGVNDDKASMLSGASYSSVLSRAHAGRTESILSDGGSSGVSGLTGPGSSLASRKTKITTTSVPLYSLFQDHVNLSKLDSMDKEMKSEMRDKMAVYEKKKILEDNKRSTLYKKKKPKDDEDEEEKEEEERKRKEEDFLKEKKKRAEKLTRSYGLSGCLNLNTALEKDKNTSIDDWLKSVRPPPRKPTTDGAEPDPLEGAYDDLDASASEFDFSSRRASCTVDEEEEEGEYNVTSRYRSRFHTDSSNGDVSPERLYRGAGSPLGTDFASNGFKQSTRSYGTYEESRNGTSSYRDSSTKTKFGHPSRYESGGTEGGRNRREVAGEEEEDEVAAFIAQTRQRIRSRATTTDYESDEVLTAWRAQQETKLHGRSES